MKKFKKWFDSAIIKEDESKTASNERHFVLNNGTRKAVFSPSPMNCFDEEKKVWKPIDNSLKKTEGGYVAQLGKYTATLSKKDENEAVEVKNGDDLISWEYLGNNANLFPGSEKSGSPSAVKRQSKLNVKTKIPDPFNLTSASRAVFADAEGDVDLDYSIEGNGVKENILIKEKSDSYHYYFRLRVAGFEMKNAADGVGLEFYKPGVDPEQAEAQNPEFVMPAPFMYDANGSCCGDVKYGVEKIGDDTYLFSIEASSEWINADDRVFPVCIDPQLICAVEGDGITVTHQRERRNCCSSGSCCGEPEWINAGNPTYNYIFLKNYSDERITATLHINKSADEPIRNGLISATLVFRQCSGETYNTSRIVVINNTEYTHSQGNEIRANVTGLYNNATDSFNVKMSMKTLGGIRKFSLPILELNYRSAGSEVGRKTLSVATGASAEFDVITGNATVDIDDIEDPVLGVSVAHVHKPNDEFVEYGRDFRLNLNEKMLRTSMSSTGAQYAYTDALGDVHTFNEHFYRIDANGEKEYLTTGIGSITADADGRLWKNGTEVFRELMTDRGLRASARLENVVNNAEWVEKRVDEEKQVEEQVKSYRDMLHNFVSIDKRTGNQLSCVETVGLNSPDSIESFLTDIDCCSHLLLPKEEGLSYKSLFTQKNSLVASRTALGLQKESLIDNARSLFLQYNSPDSLAYQRKSDTVQKTGLDIEKSSIQYQIDNPQPGTDTTSLSAQLNLIGTENVQGNTRFGLLVDSAALINAQESQLEAQKALISDQIRYFPGIGTVSSGNGGGTLTYQYYNIEDQIEAIDRQLSDLNAQIELYVAKSKTYQTQFRTYYKEYRNLNNQLKNLRLQIPVAYLASDDNVKCFNADGKMVAVQNKYGKYVVIEHEKYLSSGKDRISSISDQDGKTMKFLYNGDNKLSEICNSLGERVRFKYDDNGYLTGVERVKLPSLTLQYNPSFGNQRISGIESSDKTFVGISYFVSGMLKKITANTVIDSIGHDSISASSTVTLSEMNVEYTADETKLTYDKGKAEIYKINTANELISARSELVNGKVTGAEEYTYDNYLPIRTEYADESCLNRYSYAEFDAHKQIGTVEETTYNSFKEPISVVRSTYAVPRTENDSPTEQTSAEYIYNDDHNLIEKRTAHCYGCCAETNDAAVAIEKYFYDNAGEIVRTESYVEGEEQKTGVTVEEHFFNDQGVEIRSTTCNSLDPSSKFYTEYEVDDNGKILSAFDETGEHKTAFDYERDGVTVRTKRYSNGSKFSYGRDKDGSAVAITQSTESGEENSTKQARTLDVVTEVKSGNNTVRYTYDEKRRVKTVSLNKNADGEDDVYVSYEYSENPDTHAETVRAEMKDGTVSTVTRDVFGNAITVVNGKRSETDPTQIDTIGTVSNLYDETGRLIRMEDSVSGEITIFTYDDKGNLTSADIPDPDAPDYSEVFAYDEHKKKMTVKEIKENDVTVWKYEYAYKQTADESLDSITVNETVTVRPDTDALGRNVGKTIAFSDKKLSEKISYVKFGDHATNLPASVRFGTDGVFDGTLQYKYDGMGNIIEVAENGRQIRRYEYDALDRLTREDNVTFGKTTTWAYDNNGNIIASYEYAITTSPTDTLQLRVAIPSRYTYQDNSDRLISYYNGETGDASFTYDEIGNPTVYRGKTASWGNGRQMVAFDGHTFAYDARGRRTAKDSITFTYDSNGNLIRQSDGLEFLYDHTGVFAVNYNNETYYYRKDAQGNVIALLDNNGAVVVKYGYDAWGNCLTTVQDVNATDIANLNPFRYRGYYYDVETKLYFLKTRYYDPEIGRFLTIDDISYLDPDSINGLNLYAYCGNNPVNSADYNGTFVLSTFLITIAIGALIGGAISGGFEIAHQVRMYGWDTDSWDWKQIGLSTLGGVVAGAISAIPIPGFQGFGGFILHYGLAFATGAIGAVAGGMISGSVKPDALSIFKAVLIGGFANVIANGLSDYFKYSKASKIFNQSRKAKSSLVQELQGHPLNMGPKALKGRYVNAFKDTTLKEIEDLIENANSLFRYGVFSSIFSSLLSGWN